MKTLIELFLAYLLRISFWFRYKVKIQGLEKLNPETLSKPGGILFLPNHPTVFVDPTLVALAVLNKYPIRPMIVEYMYYLPIVNYVMRKLNAVPIPNFNTSSNSLKRKRSEKVIQTVIKDLHAGDNFMIAPAGKTKSTGYESIGAASAVHRIIQEVPEANIVLVRTKGLWGSSFSRVYTGKSPPMFPTIFRGIRIALKNLLFFTPRREVIIQFEPAPADFPYNASRLELNKYLEAWYNRPDGLSNATIGDSLVLVPYSMWNNKLPEIPQLEKPVEAIDVSTIPKDIQQKVTNKLAEMTEYDPAAIKPEMNLSTDLGLDSLDSAELIVFLQDQFDIRNVPVSELTTVARLMGIASKQIICKEESEEEEGSYAKWKKKLPSRYKVQIAPGETIPEVFFNICEKMGNAPACADQRSGVLTYSQLKLRVLLMAEHIRHMPGEYIGILLPASVAANVLVLATLVAGKIPLMINWTVGPRHLESVVKLSNVKVVLTAWSFIDRLENVDLDGLEPFLVMLEEVRHSIGFLDKLKAFWRSKKGTKSLLKIFNLQNITKDSKAVLLFTSGTESMPKGVPLTHNNILSNQRSAYGAVDLYSDDVIFGILPPFHAFGFTISGLLGLLSGIKVAYSPDPTNGKSLAKGIEKWGISVTCGAPTFLKAMLKASRPEQLRTLRLCVTGAEKAPPELFQLMEQLGKPGTLIEGYGITECSPVLTFNRLGKQPRGVGQALPNIELLVVHPESNELLPIGSQGLILARGPNIFSGYLNPGISSPFITIQGKEWYKTGDLGFLDEEGRLTISGRLKRFIKVGPEMISLASIEDALLQVAIKKGWLTKNEGPTLAVCAKEAPGEKPRIYLFTKFDTSVDEVNKSLKESGFSNLVKVANVMHLSEIPIMGTGKINYRALEGQYLAKT